MDFLSFYSVQKWVVHARFDPAKFGNCASSVVRYASRIIYIKVNVCLQTKKQHVLLQLGTRNQEWSLSTGINLKVIRKFLLYQYFCLRLYFSSKKYFAKNLELCEQIQIFYCNALVVCPKMRLSYVVSIYS